MFYDYISLMSNLNDEDESKVKADPAKKEEEKKEHQLKLEYDNAMLERR